ncbi:hypothetical protein LPJ75_006305, partial [Coemansia sp. RSA 2598]
MNLRLRARMSSLSLVARPRSKSSATTDSKAASITHTAPVDTPPTPKSFNDLSRLPSSGSACEDDEFSNHVPLSRLDMAATERVVLDVRLPALSKPSDKGLPYPHVSSTFMDPLAMPASPITPTARATTSSSQSSRGSGVFSANPISSQTSASGYSAPAHQRYSVGRPIERPFTSITSSIRKSRASMASSLAAPP